MARITAIPAPHSSPAAPPGPPPRYPSGQPHLGRQIIHAQLVQLAWCVRFRHHTQCRYGLHGGPSPLGCPWQVTRDLTPGRTEVWNRHPSSAKIATRPGRDRRVNSRLASIIQVGHAPGDPSSYSKPRSGTLVRTKRERRETRKRWWNGRWGRIAVRTSSSTLMVICGWVEAREGGADGRRRFLDADN